MELKNIAGFRSLDAFVGDKLNKLNGGEATFDRLFGLMFSERENVFWEENDGYHIIKTTYGESMDRILSRASALKAKLKALSVPEGAVVGLYMENSIEWIHVFWSILMCGCNPLLMNLRMDEVTLEHVLKNTGVACVVSDGAAFSVPTIIASEIGDGTELVRGPFGKEIMLLSSGSSENVKVCTYTASEIIAQIGNAAEIIRKNKQIKKHWKGELKHLTFLPFYHVFGLFAVYFWFGFFSRTFVYLRRMDGMTILNTVRKHEVTHIFAVPALWNAIYRVALRTMEERKDNTIEKFRKGMALTGKVKGVPVLGSQSRKLLFKELRENIFGESICFLISGGAEIRSEVLEFYNGIGYHMANGYGMTEVGITSVELSMDPKVLASGSIGEPMASVHYEVGANNELIISGKSIAKRVCIDGVEQPLDNGRLRTGDLVKNEKGRLYLLGRRDDTIIDENGENLNPTIVENLITDVEPGSVCLIGSRENDTVIPTLLVSVKPFIGDKQLEALKSGIRDKLSKNGLSGHIGHIVFITEPLMRESEFKLNRRLIASKYASGRFRRLETEKPEGQRIRGEIESRVGACFAEILGIKAEDIDPIGDFFIALGGSSLDFYRLVAALEREFGVTLPNDPSGILCTVEGMSEYIESRLSE